MPMQCPDDPPLLQGCVWSAPMVPVGDDAADDDPIDMPLGDNNCMVETCFSQDSSAACAAFGACMWEAEDEMCSEADNDEMDSSGSGSGSGEMDNIAESVCTSDGLSDNMTACDANAMCMWETFDTGDDGDDTTMMGGMCSAMSCFNQVRMRLFCWPCCSVALLCDRMTCSLVASCSILRSNYRDVPPCWW